MTSFTHNSITNWENEMRQSAWSKGVTMQTLKITIDCTNAAFEPDAFGECARILREMADRLEQTGIPPVPRDINGNVCGEVGVQQ